MWRCLNDIFSYCKATPTFGVAPTELTSIAGTKNIVTISDAGGSCTKNPSTCHHHETLLAHLKVLPANLKPNPRRKDSHK